MTVTAMICAVFDDRTHMGRQSFSLYEIRQFLGRPGTGISEESFLRAVLDGVADNQLVITRSALGDIKVQRVEL